MFEKAVGMEPGETLGGQLIRWCRGPWNGRRFGRIIGWLSACYLIFVCVAIWCPPVRGVVVDARTGGPVPDAQVLVCPKGFFMLAVEAGNEALEGKTLSDRTSGRGRFSVPGGAVRPWPGEAGALNVFSPFQWLTHVQVAVWAPGYGTQIIEIPSYAVVPWWSKNDDKEGWNVSRLRLPVWGFWVHLALRKPEGEQEWRRVCGQAVTARAEGIIPDEWLFNDLSGYLERWPQGEKAGEYLGMAMFSALVMHERATNAGKPDVRRFMQEDRLLMDLAEKIRRPSKPSGYATSDYASNLEQVKEEYAKLLKVCPDGGAK